MIASDIFAIVALALSASAAPTSTAEGSFKLGVTTAAGNLVYMTKTEIWTKNKAEAIDCILKDTKILCGPDKKMNLVYGIPATSKTPAMGGHTVQPLKPFTVEEKNKNKANYGAFTIDSKSKIIKWTGNGNAVVNFSTMKVSSIKSLSTETDDQNKIYAEVCSSSGHLDGKTFVPGKARAYYNQLET